MGTGANVETFTALSGYLDQLGAWGAPLYCLFLIASGIFPLPGFGVLVVASGFLFGFPYGFLLVYPSAVAGAMIAFAAGRQMPKAMRDKMPKKLLALQDAVSEGGFSTLLLLRLTPLPFAFSNLFLGSTLGVGFWSHAGATALGFLRLLLNSYLGFSVHRALSGDGSSGRVETIISIAGTFAAIAAMGSIGKRMLQQAASQSGAKKQSPPPPPASAPAPTARGARAERVVKSPARPRRASKSPKRLVAAM